MKIPSKLDRNLTIDEIEGALGSGLIFIKSTRLLLFKRQIVISTICILLAILMLSLMI